MTAQATHLDSRSVVNESIPFMSPEDADPAVETVPLPFEAMQALVKCRTTSVAHVGTSSRRDVVLFRVPRDAGDARRRAQAIRTQAARHVSHAVLMVVDFEGAGPLSRDDLSALIDVWDQVEREGGVVYLSGLDVESTIQLKEAGIGDYFEIRADATAALSDIASRVQDASAESPSSRGAATT